MSSKSKTFVCDQHASNISTKLQTFYRDQLFFDIALTTKTDNLKVYAHRTVLSASSDYFLAMLCSTLKEARSDVIELEIDGATLKLIVDFMYSGTIELRSENVNRLLTAADVLKMSTLKVACFDFIEETLEVTNWLSIASLAKHQQFTELYRKAFEFALQHFEEVYKTEEFLQLTEEQLSELISSDDLCVNSEETVFHSVVSWVKHDKGNREKSMLDLMSHVRFSFLKPDFIIDNRHLLSKTYECLELLFSWLESHLSRTKLSKRHSERKKVNETKREILGCVSGIWTEYMQFHTLDPESNKWCSEHIPPPPTERCDYSSIVTDGKLIIAGGYLIGSGSTNTVECLNLETMEWTNLPPMRQARKHPGIAELNGDLYVVGGHSGEELLRSVEKYDFRTCEWQELAPMHSEHDRVSLTALGELLYAGSFSSIESFNPAKNEWTQLPHKNERLEHFGLAGVGGHLYAVGGFDSLNGLPCKTVERFHPLTNTWTVITPGLELAFSYLTCVSWNNRLLAGGGVNTEGVSYSYSLVVYNPDENEWKTLCSLVEHDFNLYTASLLTFTK